MGRTDSKLPEPRPFPWGVDCPKGKRSEEKPAVLSPSSAASGGTFPPQGEGLNISEPHNLPTFGIPGELDGFAGERRSKGAGRGRPRGAQAKADFAQKNGAPGELGGSLGRGGARERGEGDQGEPKQKRTLRKKNGAPANLGVRWGGEEQGSGARATKGSPKQSGLCDDVGQNCNKTGTKMGQNRDESSLLSWCSGSISPLGQRRREISSGNPPVFYILTVEQTGDFMYNELYISFWKK